MGLNNQTDTESVLKEFISSITPEFYVTGINKLLTRMVVTLMNNISALLKYIVTFQNVAYVR